jgi:hypothetical protein
MRYDDVAVVVTPPDGVTAFVVTVRGATTDRGIAIGDTTSEVKRRHPAAYCDEGIDEAPASCTAPVSGARELSFGLHERPLRDDVVASIWFGATSRNGLAQLSDRRQDAPANTVEMSPGAKAVRTKRPPGYSATLIRAYRRADGDDVVRLVVTAGVARRFLVRLRRRGDVLDVEAFGRRPGLASAVGIPTCVEFALASTVEFHRLRDASTNRFVTATAPWPHGAERALRSTRCRKARVEP